MKLLKPTWVNHDGNPIFSVDIHPDGTRFATGGLGQDSAGRIVIWNMTPVLQCEAKSNGTGNSTSAESPKILCQLDHHNACVNCVRWSNSGDLLASGSDDKAIIIWKMTAKTRTTLISSGNAFGKPCYETWKPTAELRNHKGDVLHLAWSPEDKYLASASVDTKVIIWDAQHFPQVIYELTEHISFVKGVSWDPIGKYVATQSDDKTLKIWRTSDWQTEHSVTAPFQESAGTTHVLRLDWSPDGLYLVSAHAMNQGGPTAQIIDREGWKASNDFVGHRKAIACVRFNPNILLQGKSKCCVVALGSKDKTISVWSTALKRPLAVLKDLFTSSVMDLSWSACGKILMACSWDGTLAVAQFKKSEIGDSLSTEEKVSLHHRFYGNRISMNSCDVVQNYEVFLARQKAENKKALEKPVAVKKSHEKMVESESQEPIVRGPDKQIETRTSDGKRRITPKFLLPSDEVDITMNEESNSNHFGNLKDSEKKDQISLREKMISSISEIKIPSELPSIKSTDSTEQQPLIKDTWQGNEISKEPESESISKTGEIPPTETPIISMEINKVNDDSSVTKQPESELAVNNIDKEIRKQDESLQGSEEKTNNEEVNDNSIVGMKRKRRLSDEMKPPEKLPKKGKLLQPPSIVFPSSSAVSEKPSAKDDRMNTISPSASTSISSIISISPTHKVNGHVPVCPKPHSAQRGRLPPMKTEPLIARRIQTKKDVNYVVEVNNKSRNKCTFILTCKHDKNSFNGLEWNICTMFPVCGLSGDSLRIVACCEDSTVHILDLKGRYAFPPSVLSSYPSKMFQHGPYLLIVTIKATLYLWNIYTKKNVIKSESIAHLLDYQNSTEPRSAIDVAHTSITKLGSPIIVLTNGKAFHFNLDMQVWNHYIDPGISITRSSLDVRPTLTWQPHYTIIKSPEKYSEPYIITKIKLKLATATELNLTDAVHTLLISLANTLASHSLTQELHQLCIDLLGPAHSSAKFSSTWNPTIAGVKKRVVLREILTILLNDLQWQDFFCEFDEMLADVEKEDNNAMVTT